MACADCFRGSIHEGQPKGEVTTIHGLNTYVSRPPNGAQPRGVVVFIPDAFGWEFGNNRLLADTYAAKGGFLVYLPDFMNGNAAPIWMFDSMQVFTTGSGILAKGYHLFWAMIGFVPFIISNRPGKTFPRVKGFFEQLRKDEGATLSIGAAGFCWGGKHVALLSHGHEIDGKPLLDAGFTGHPSLLSLPADYEKITRPVSFALAGKDSQVSPEHAKKLKAAVEAKPSPATGEAVIYEGTGHGFCVRADVEHEDIAAQATAAEDQCINWFHAHFQS